jgi:hypothetical protein
MTSHMSGNLTHMRDCRTNKSYHGCELCVCIIIYMCMCLLAAENMGHLHHKGARMLLTEILEILRSVERSVRKMS